MTQIAAPLNGVMRTLADVPDPVFAEGIIGPGFAVEPELGEAVEVVSPISGTVAKVHPHAFVVVKDKLSVLVHLGIDTVKLNGEGFEVLAVQGSEVEAGQVMVKWDTKAIAEKGLAIICPVIVLDTFDPVETTVAAGETVVANQAVANYDA
ncbi:PTS system, glucose subfamily, IIA component [Gleimia coleocanis DSM 15436]|uniref:PTS system, glucose subfamily, IIA component n=1 Tax=Gleimia coleocanis DSM 15436 TaxID=525245 RepID=C0VYE6_9ACTO|nr:PTS glucose transporter subunit IIA [Gleimia coleocanis]EEH64449.1 PTS system, glucose subfamily, IIA component [Gleimia coleocanis DSM 15436]